MASRATAALEDMAKNLVHGNAPTWNRRFSLRLAARAVDERSQRIDGAVNGDRLGYRVHVPDDQCPGGEVVRPLGGHLQLLGCAIFILIPDFDGNDGRAFDEARVIDDARFHMIRRVRGERLPSGGKLRNRVTDAVSPGETLACA